MIKTKYKLLTVLVIMSLNFYSQKIDTVKISNQVWTSKNLDITKFQNGDVIPQVKTNEDWIKAGEEGKPAWCYYNNDSIKNAKYGKLYNWFAVNDARDLAPKGWRLAYAEDYAELALFHKSDLSYLKSKKGWLVIGNEFSNGINKYGFNILPSGIRNGDGKFSGIGYCTNLWSITSYENTEAWSLNIARQGTNLSMKMPKTYGLSVRLIKDDGLRRNNDYNNLLRSEVDVDMDNHKFDTALFKLNHIMNSNAFLNYLDYRNLMECYLAKKDLASAELFFNRSIDSVKANYNKESNFYNSFGWNLILAQLYKPAIKYLEIARNKFPKDIFILGNLAHAYMLSGNIELAKKIYIENVVKVDTIEILNESYAPDGSIVYVSHGPELSKNDTTWIKMILEDFSYFKKEGISCKDFDLISTIFNLKKENGKLRKEIYEDETVNNDSAIYKLNKIISSHYFIEEYDYETLLYFYLKNNDLANSEIFFNQCIETKKVDEAKFYNEFVELLISFKFYNPAVKYLKPAVSKYSSNLKIKSQYATALLLSGEIEIAKKIFIDNILETDQNIGHIGLDGDSLIVFDSINNKYNFIRMVGVETDWMALVKRNFEKYEEKGIECPGFYEINELLISQHDALMRKRLELQKEKK
jgi:uncharacterized protein (TIGR02145 family)